MRRQQRLAADCPQPRSAQRRRVHDVPCSPLNPPADWPPLTPPSPAPPTPPTPPSPANGALASVCDPLAETQRWRVLGLFPCALPSFRRSTPHPTPRVPKGVRTFSLLTCSLRPNPHSGLQPRVRCSGTRILRSAWPSHPRLRPAATARASRLFPAAPRRSGSSIQPLSMARRSVCPRCAECKRVGRFEK